MARIVERVESLSCNRGKWELFPKYDKIIEIVNNSFLYI